MVVYCVEYLQNVLHVVELRRDYRQKSSLFDIYYLIL